MSNRNGERYQGSSRSTRDDSRKHKEKVREFRDTSRTRSRSPQRRSPSPVAKSSRYPSDANSSRSWDLPPRNNYEDKSIIHASNDWEDSDEDVPPPPPPPRITKISMGFSKPKEPIKMTIGGGMKPTNVVTKKPVASVFGNDDDDEPEEMPAEARMRMRNIGRETPTSAGPNSFGKTKQGFCDAKKVFEKNLKQALETNESKKSIGKLPQTIYKLQGP